MTIPLTISAFGILTWLKEMKPANFVSLELAATTFGLLPEQMKRNMQWLQRYECVKRGGVGKAEWSITELGLVRLGEGRFSPVGAFLSPYDYSRRSTVNGSEPVAQLAEADGANVAQRSTLDQWTDSTVPTWARPSPN